MRRSSKPLPKDPNKLTFEDVRLSTEEPEEKPIEPEQPKERSLISKYLSQIGRKGGLRGGPARAKKLSAKRRKEIAEEAAKMRWAAKLENK
jgi:hypothetical protein